MRITKVMLEEQVRYLEDEIKRYYQENDRLKLQVIDQRGIIDIYSRMTPLIIGAERVTDALAHVIGDLKTWKR